MSSLRELQQRFAEAVFAGPGVASSFRRRGTAHVWKTGSGSTAIRYPRITGMRCPPRIRS